MKDLGISFDSFISILLPGWIATLLAAMLVNDSDMPAWAGTLWRDWGAALQEQDFQFGVVFVGLSAFLGVTLASVGGALELFVFDWVQYQRIARVKKQSGYDREKYDADWNAYVDSLCLRPQPYLRRLAIFYFFEMRTGLALAVTAALAGYYSAGAEWFLCAALGGLLLVLSFVSHSQLADHRHRLGTSTRAVADSVARIN